MPEDRQGEGAESVREPSGESPPEARRKPPANTVMARYGRMGHVGEFLLPRSLDAPSCGGKLILQTERGVEIGEPIPLTCTLCANAVSRDQVREYVKNSGADALRYQAGRVLREASSDDLIEQRHIDAQKQEKLDICERLVAKHGLEMKLVDCEHVFGGERVVFYFMAESRVDFRGLVKDLADEFQTRIEMRQIGARDEARLVADYETCGRECCCRNFLKTLKPINMRMAKMQKATLDPSKVSGRCGRLKCCLRYEHASYEELDARLPRVGQRVNTTEGEGVVLDRQILAQLLQVEGEAGQVFSIRVEQLLAPGERPPPKSVSGREGRGDDEEEWRPFDQPKAVPSRASSGESQESVSAAESAGDSANSETPSKPTRRRRRRGRRGRGRRRKSD
jgi:cell fate regulator YaaT (PSP1 superfamily)